MNTSALNLLRLSAAVSIAVVALSLTGCTLGPVTGSASAVDTVASAFGGTIHGGPSPVVGARVVLYATTSGGYGAGVALQEATANYPASSPVAHQDTDTNGNFSFVNNFTCPAGQFAYVVAYGGNAGGGNNANSIFAAPLGSCDTLYTGTTYNGSNIWIDELTTVATAYALNNFIAVSGDAVDGYTVGIGAPATNNGGVQPTGSATASNGVTTGCVVNSYYNPASAPNNCITTSTAGLRHAFANALSLVSTSTGAAKATTASGAVVPTAEINLLGNIMQACVNSSGGGSDPTTGLPTTVTGSSGTSHDGTACGKLFAFTSYTNNGASTGTLTAAGDTLDALINLVKRPTGTASTFDSSCDSNSGSGTTTAVSCIYGLAAPSGFYQPSMTAAPGDYMIAIAYPKGSFSNSTTNTFASQTTPTCTSGAPANNGLLYPTFIQTDINDNVLIGNADQSTPVCSEMISIGFDGSLLGSSGVTNSTAYGVFVSITADAWGHVIVPFKTTNGVRFYQYGANGLSDPADSTMPVVALVQSPATGTTGTTSAYLGEYAAVDGNSKVYVASANNTISNWGNLTPTALSHTTPAYTTAQNAITTSTGYTATVDRNNTAFAAKSTASLWGTAVSETSSDVSPTATGASSTITETSVVVDNSNNVYEVVNNGTTDTAVIKVPYTTTATKVTYTSGATTVTAASPAYAFSTTSNIPNASALSAGVKNAVIDGNNVMWFPDFSGAALATNSYSGYLRGYDTVNNYGTPMLAGCKFASSVGYSISAWTVGASSTTFTTATAPPVVGGVGTLSNFATSTFFNGVSITITATTTASPYTFTVANTFGQTSGATGTESGTLTSRAGTTCGTNPGDSSYPSSTPYVLYQTRGIAVDSMGNLWFPNGTQATVTEIIGVAAPTLPNYIHNGISQKP